MTTRVALITGSSRGIGKSIALQLARDGFQVAVNYYYNPSIDEKLNQQNEAEAMAVKQAIEESGAAAVAIGADVSDSNSAGWLVEETVSKLGRIDVLVNNAGINRDQLLLRISDDEWSRVIETNLSSAFYCTRAALKYMIKQRYGRVISISSVVGISGNAGQAHYAASKSGLLGFTYSVAREYGRRGVNANVIAPGYIQSDMTAQLSAEQTARIAEGIAVGRLGTPDDIAGVVSFLVSSRADYVSGQLIRVDGGMGGL